MPNMRQVLIDLSNQAKDIHARERRITLDSIELVGRLDRLNAAVNFCMTTAQFAREIGLTENKWWKRVQVSRLLTRFPEARTMLIDGDTEVSHLATIAPKITDANAAVLLPAIKGKTCREVAELASRITPRGELLPKEPEIEFRIRLKKSQYELIDRARAVLSHSGRVPSEADVIEMAFEALLDRRDPIRKAERAARRQAKIEEARLAAASAGAEAGLAEDVQPNASARKDDVENTTASASARKDDVENTTASASSGKELCADRLRRPRPAIPMGIKHAVILRDGGRCSWRSSTGERCPDTMMLELDHVNMWSMGGGHTLDNLRLLCRRHHRQHSERQMADIGARALGS